jgi:hypothetical protein
MSEILCSFKYIVGVSFGSIRLLRSFVKKSSIEPWNFKGEDGGRRRGESIDPQREHTRRHRGDFRSPIFPPLF